MSLITINIQGNWEDIEKKLNKILSNQTFIINNMPTKEQFETAISR